MTFQILLQFI